jgi:hypothetical protein
MSFAFIIDARPSEEKRQGPLGTADSTDTQASEVVQSSLPEGLVSLPIDGTITIF